MNAQVSQHDYEAGLAELRELAEKLERLAQGEDVWPHVGQPVAEGDGSAYWAVPE